MIVLHHPSLTGIVAELLVVAGLSALFGLVAWRERRRRASRRERRSAPMRDA
jgi:hypothetical protein